MGVEDKVYSMYDYLFHYVFLCLAVTVASRSTLSKTDI